MGLDRGMSKFDVQAGAGVPEGEKPALVTIGGSSSAVLMAAAGAAEHYQLTCILTTLDSGSSTGVARALFGIPAPGDIRSALAALAAPDADIQALADLLEYRFAGPEGSPFEGMAVGNLLLAALTLQRGSFVSAIEAVGGMLRIGARVLPVTDANTELCAELADGTLVEGEANVRAPGKPPIRRVFPKDPRASILPQAQRAILEAEIVVLGPGCLYTSVLACLAIRGMREALATSAAAKVLVANNTTTPGQTDGMGLAEQVQAVMNTVGVRVLGHILVNDSAPPEEMRARYARLGLHWLQPTPEQLTEVEKLGAKPVLSDLIETNWSGVRELHKLDTIRHDGQKLLNAIGSLIPSR